MDQTLQMGDDHLGKMTWQADQYNKRVFHLSVRENMADISRLNFVSGFQAF